MKKYGLAIADVSKWHLAWDRYSLGAAMVQQMSFRCAQRHKAIVVEVHVFAPLFCMCDLAQCGMAGFLLGTNGRFE